MCVRERCNEREGVRYCEEEGRLKRVRAAVSGGGASPEMAIVPAAPSTSPGRRAAGDARFRRRLVCDPFSRMLPDLLAKVWPRKSTVLLCLPQDQQATQTPTSRSPPPALTVSLGLLDSTKPGVGGEHHTPRTHIHGHSPLLSSCRKEAKRKEKLRSHNQANKKK